MMTKRQAQRLIDAAERYMQAAQDRDDARKELTESSWRLKDAGRNLAGEAAPLGGGKFSVQMKSGAGYMFEPLPDDTWFYAKCVSIVKE